MLDFIWKFIAYIILFSSLKALFLYIFSRPKIRKAQQKEEELVQEINRLRNQEADLAREMNESIQTLKAEQTEQFEKLRKEMTEQLYTANQ
jgi:uncharacterized protein YlxW (UPF0749 family)